MKNKYEYFPYRIRKYIRRNGSYFFSIEDYIGYYPYFGFWTKLCYQDSNDPIEYSTEKGAIKQIEKYLDAVKIRKGNEIRITEIVK